MTHPQQLSATMESERETLKSLARGRLVAVDIGTFRGGTAHCLLEAMPNGHVYTIDTFDGRSGGKVVASWPKHELIKDVINNLIEFEDRYTLVVSDSLQAASMFGRESVDLVFLDASHDCKSVMNDIIAWLPKIRPGGIMCGHDYDKNSKFVPQICLDEHHERDCCNEHNCHPGVVRAVDFMFKDVQSKDSVWWVGQ